MTIQELADQSGYHRVSLARLIRRGAEIPGVARTPSGRMIIVDCPELRDWIAWARQRNDRRFKNVRYYKDRAERRAKTTPADLRSNRFISAPEAARKLGYPVSYVRRILERYRHPEVRGKRLFYPITPEVEKWLSARHATYLGRSQDISKLNTNFQRSIFRLADTLTKTCVGLGPKDFEDARFSIVSSLERSRETIEDLIAVVSSDDFQEPIKAITALNARSKERQMRRDQKLQEILQGVKF